MIKLICLRGSDVLEAYDAAGNWFLSQDDGESRGSLSPYLAHWRMWRPLTTCTLPGCNSGRKVRRGIKRSK